MKILDHEKTSIPPNLDNTILITEPHTFYGFLIKSQYDEERLKINDKFNAKYYSVETDNDYVKLYGIIRPLDSRYNTLLQELYKLDNSLPKKQLIPAYNDILKEYGLYSSENYLNYNLNLYPVDNEYITELMGENPNGLSGWYLINFDNEIPIFQQIAYSGLYIVGNAKF